MSRRASSSTRPRRARLPDRIGEYPLGKETGLPLIMCDICGQHRVLELVAQTDEHGNKGRVFFKCPSNYQGVPGTCTFFEWQRDYLAILVEDGKIAMTLHQPVARDEEADSVAVAQVHAVPKNPMEVKMDALIGAVKALSMVMGAGVAVGAMYALK